MSQLISEPRPSGLRGHTGYWLNRLRGLVHAGFDAALAAEDVSVAQWAVMITLYRGDAVTPLEVARFIDVDAGALTRLIDRMEAKGLVRRVAITGDRRSMRLALTDRALSITPRLATLADQNDRVFFGVLSADEHATLRRLLGKLLRGQGVDVAADWDPGTEPDVVRRRGKSP